MKRTMSADELLTEIVNSNRAYLHYTDGSGIDAIMMDGVIRTDSKGYVYFTQEPFTQQEAHLNLFIGATTHAGRGTHVLAVDLSHGLPLEGQGLYEARTRQSVRLDQHRLIYAGPNPFDR